MPPHEETGLHGEDHIQVRLLRVEMLNMTESVKETSKSVQDLASQAMADREKFTHIHDKFDRHAEVLGSLEDSVLKLTTEIIPSIKSDASVKGSYWKIVGGIGLSVASAVAYFSDGMGSVMTERNKALVQINDDRNKVIIEAVKLAIDSNKD